MIDRWNMRAGDEQLPDHPVAEHGRTGFHFSSLRVGLALARVALLFALFCWLAMLIGLQMRDARERGWGLASSATMSTTSGSPLFDLPFLGTTVELDAGTATERSVTLERLSDHGIDWGRQRFDWNILEPESGSFDWRSSDAIIEAFSKSDVTLIAVLDGSPAWARHPRDRPPNDNPLAPPADPAAFARFAAAFAQRYGEHVRFYQIWHEPNIAPHWGNQHIAPTEYAQLLIEASRAIRAVDDDAAIIAAALAPTADRGHTAVDEIFFLQRLYAAGVQPHVDLMAIEPFGFGFSAQDPTQRRTVLNFQRAALVRRAMVSAGDAGTPLLAARFGWNRYPQSSWRTVEPAAQQAYLDQSIELAWQQWPWLVGLGWAIDQPSTPGHDPLWGFALDDRLFETLEAWSSSTPGQRSGYRSTIPWGLLLAAAAMATVLWRIGASLPILPWVRWQTKYRSYRPAIKILIWLALLVSYFFATWPPLILFLLMMASVLIAMEPLHGLWLAAALLPFQFQHKELHLVDLTWMIPPAQAAVLASIPTIFLRFKRNLRQRPISVLLRTFQPLDWFAVAWLVISLLTMANVWHWPAYWGGMLELVIVPLVLYWMARLFATDQRAQTLTATALFAGGVLVATVGLVGWAMGGGTDADSVRRLVGPYFSPNHAALYLERSLLLGMGIWLFWKNRVETTGRCRPKNTLVQRGMKGRSDDASPPSPPTLGGTLGSRLAKACTSPRIRGCAADSRPHSLYDHSCQPVLVGLVAAIAGIGLALLLTASRGALLLGMPIGAGLFTWLTLSTRTDPPHLNRLQRNGHQHRLWIGLVIFAMIVSAAIAVAFWPRLSNTATVIERIDVWKASLDLWRSFPMLGTGPGGFYWRFPAQLPIGSSLDPDLRHPHNIWLESLTMWGAIGAIWLLTLLIWAIRLIRHERRMLRKLPQRGIVIGLLAGLAAGLAHGQVDAYGALGDIAGWNWLALGLWRMMVRRGLVPRTQAVEEGDRPGIHAVGY